MVVRTQEKRPGHKGTVGLHIGALNVQQYFPRSLQMVELELDHLRIVCQLEPSFWQDSPEIHDQRLSLWLESKRTSGKLSGHSAPVSLVPLENSGFRLQLMSKEEADRALETPVPATSSTVFVAPGTRAGVLMERRKRDLEHMPERRKVGRRKLLNLGGDDRSSIATNH